MLSLYHNFASAPHAEVVKNVLARQASRLPPYVDAADVEGVAWAAYVAFMKDEAPKLSGDDVAPHLYVVARRAVVDELRRLDPLNRHTRRLASKLTEVQKEMIAEFGRKPSVAQLARAVGVSKRSAEEALQIAEAANAVEYHDSLDSVELIAPLDRAGGDHDVRPVLLQEVEKLPARMQHIIRRVYFDGIPMTEVAREIGRSAQRVGQICDDGLKRLRRSEVVQELGPKP